MGRGPRSNQSITAKSLLFGPRKGKGILSEEELEEKRNEISFIMEDGNKVWRNKEGQKHRKDGPAVERADGGRDWWVNDKLHREDGPATEKASGTREWRVNGKLHREDGPAIERANGTREWWVNGKLHREDGPASEGANNGYREWWLNGIRFDNEEDYSKALSK